ncbi:MAG: bifunctional phosphopantothenoylcysteine decarboxylase/phosphopantothenate--cysteine ligase CoaBC [Gemmatimonadetes bacterium]|nr:bifunctional phosphopantothenoylcysteine decarboxylase/phosphopantothenate--cysteine ligase CoaBC [Gemmatimonadota bacterium]
MASYKSATLARRLTQAGAEVDVVLTRSAQEFVGAVTFEALTGRPVHTELIEAGHALDHIRLARSADVIAVAPATADFLSRAAAGRADDLLTACLLATQAPVFLAPAMNDRMWEHPQTGRNVAQLREIGYHVLDPDTGDLAVGEGSGPGRLPEPEVLMAHIGRRLEGQADLKDRHVLVTAGPTREAVDPVRFLSNRSSGKMGVALAAAAWRRGARVTLVCGPLSVPHPVGATIVSVESVEEMHEAVRRSLPSADVLVMAAAPADFRPSTLASEKIKKSTAPGVIALTPTTDILQATVGDRGRGTVVIGFALETEDVLANAQRKLEGKGLDLIVVNDAREVGAGFGVDTNRVTILQRRGAPEALPLLSKDDVADAILDRAVGLLP